MTPSAPAATPTPIVTPLPAPSKSLASSSSWAALAQTVAVRKPTTTTYSRSAFKLWTKQPDGCTTREEVLIIEATTGVRSGCAVIGGIWSSAYDGATTANPSSFDIDHMVPLKEAWVSGASTWGPAQRTSFANDLTYANSLIAVTASSNRSKGDRDPAKWMPPNSAYWCTYVQSWVAVKAKWKLAMDAAEQVKVSAVLSGCPDTDNPLP